MKTISDMLGIPKTNMVAIGEYEVDVSPIVIGDITAIDGTQGIEGICEGLAEVLNKHNRCKSKLSKEDLISNLTMREATALISLLSSGEIPTVGTAKKR